jgi:hypothetical protein
MSTQTAQVLNAAIANQPMSVCGWHKKYFPTEPALILADGNPELISHGICPNCEVLAFPKAVDGHFEIVASIVAAKAPSKKCGCVGCTQGNRYGCIQTARSGDQFAVFA